jgi:hypothetical protein
MPMQACNLTWKHNISTFLSYSLSALVPPLMPADNGNAVHQSTKLGLTSGDNLHEPSGNNELSQVQPAVQGITLKMLHKIMAQPPFLLKAILSLPWLTWSLPLLMTVKQWQP